MIPIVVDFVGESRVSMQPGVIRNVLTKGKDVMNENSITFRALRKLAAMETPKTLSVHLTNPLQAAQH